MTRPLSERHILLGVTGGVAAYKAADLTSRLVKAGAEVDVVMTENARRFVAPLTFESLIHKTVYTGMWEPHVKEPAHVALSERPDLVIIAPATANMLAKMAHGLADDLLSCVLLATQVPILAAPAMNDNMYAHPATQTNLRLLTERGVQFVGPEEGRLASGKVGGKGRMSEPEAILTRAVEILTETTP